MGNSIYTKHSSIPTLDEDLHLQDLGFTRDTTYNNNTNASDKNASLLNANHHLLRSHKCWDSSSGTEVVVKIYIKRIISESWIDEMSVEHKDALIRIVKGFSLSHQPNVLGYGRFLYTDRAALVVRQYCYISLVDRITTRPFFTPLMKRWISFQILKGLIQLSEAADRMDVDQSTEYLGSIYHGDLKAENILLTGWDWVFLTDLAPFKPIAIPSDNPGTIQFFFNTAAKTAATLAPERFENHVVKDLKVEEKIFQSTNDKDETNQVSKEMISTIHREKNIDTHKMDIFSTGCVIAQIYLDEHLFDFEHLLAYSKGNCDHVNAQLLKIEDVNVRNLIHHMIQLDPSKRKSAVQYIMEWTPKVFPSYFTILHQTLAQMVSLDCDSRIKKLSEVYDSLVKIISNTNPEGPPPMVVRQVFEGYEKNSKVKKKGKQMVVEKKMENELRVRNEIEPSSEEEVQPLSDDASQGMEIVASLLCSSLRNAKSISNRIEGFEIMNKLAIHCTDFTRLQRLIPYICTMITESGSGENQSAPLVRAAAIRSLSVVIGKVTSVDNSELNIFSDYIIEKLKNLKQDPSEMVRVVFAEHLPIFSNHSKRFLDLAQFSKNHGGQDHVTGSFDVELSKLKTTFLAIVKDIVLYDQSDNVKIALFKNISKLCQFFGDDKWNVDFLSMLTTASYAPGWQLRHTFYEKVVVLAKFVNQSGLLSNIYTEALYDKEEAVVQKSLAGLCTLCQGNFLSQDNMLEIIEKILPLLHHPNTWIQYDAISFIAESARQLDIVEVACFILPMLKPHLKYQILEVNELNLLEALKTKLRRSIFSQSMKMQPKDYLEIRSLKRNEMTVHEIWKKHLVSKLSESDAEILELMFPYMEQSVTMHATKQNAQSHKESNKLLRIDLDIPAQGHLKDTTRNITRSISNPKPLMVSSKGPKNVATQPHGYLFAQSFEHENCITSIAVHQNSHCFVSGSKDFTVKLWDLGKKNLNGSIVSSLTYTVDQRCGFVNSVAFLERGNSVACSTSNGWINIFDYNIGQTTHQIAVTDKGAEFVNSFSDYVDSNSTLHPSIQAMKSFRMNYSPILIVGTERGFLTCIDYRMKTEAMKIQTDDSLSFGPVTAITGEDVWMVSGTQRGYFTLWDMRYQFPIFTDKLNDTHCSNSSFGGINALDYRTQDMGPSIYIASSCRDVAVYNLGTKGETGVYRCHKEIRPRLRQGSLNPPTLGTISSDLSISKEINHEYQQLKKKSSTLPNEVKNIDRYGLNELNNRNTWDEKSKYGFEVSCLSVAKSEFGSGFLSGGTDRKIRFWNEKDVSKSKILSGKLPEDQEEYKVLSRQPRITEEHIERKEISNNELQQKLNRVQTDHNHSVTSVSWLGEYWVSGCHGGLLKIWK